MWVRCLVRWPGDANIFKGPPVAALLACQLVSGVPQGQGHARRGRGGAAATQGSPTLLLPPLTPSPPPTSVRGAQRSSRLLPDSVASASSRPGITGCSVEISRSHGGSLAIASAAYPSLCRSTFICCSLILHLTCRGKEGKRQEKARSVIASSVSSVGFCLIVRVG